MGAMASVVAAAAIVAMGDSFASGEGGGGYERDGPAACHRSATAPVHVAAGPGAVAVNLACSGARLRNLLPAAAGGALFRGEAPQADRLAALARRAPVRAVVVTAGANDVGFGRLVAGCALAWARGSVLAPRPCHRRAQARLSAGLPALRRDLRRALAGVRAALAGGAGPTRLLAMGYSSPFPAGGRLRHPQRGWQRLRAGCPVWDADAEWALRGATPALNAAMRSAAAAAGAEFLDVEAALAGHRVCERGVAAEAADPALAEWVRPLRFAPSRLRESLHPNPLGQRALGRCLALHLARPPGEYTCRAAPGLPPSAAVNLGPAG